MLALVSSTALAQDTLKVVIGQINNWENQAPTLGQDAGIFKKHGLVLENSGTQGAGETIQAVISGSADIGAGVGVYGVMRAFSKGAPIRILAPMFTGTGDIYWYVRADSPIKTLKDATEQHTIAYSTSGSTTDMIVAGFVQELGVKAKPTKTGGPPGTYTQVMSGQIDIGWSAPPFGTSGGAGGQDPHRRARQRGAVAARSDHSRPDRQRRRLEATQGCGRSLHEGVSGIGRLDVFRIPRRSRCTPRRSSGRKP